MGRLPISCVTAMGMRRWFFPELTLRWSTRRPAIAPEVDGLTTEPHGYDDPAETVPRDRRRCVATRNVILRAKRPVASENTQLSARMTATLSAEMQDRVAGDLIADIVRAVLYDGRQTAKDRSGESLLTEARQRLERFIRARAPR